jgi:hypothetical protein
MIDTLILIALCWFAAMACKGQWDFFVEIRQVLRDHRRIMREIKSGERHPPQLRVIEGGAQ